MRTVIEKILQKLEKKNLAHRVQKSQLVTSFLTLIVCVGVLCTGSWAYFTDSATVLADTIQISNPVTQKPVVIQELAAVQESEEIKDPAEIEPALKTWVNDLAEKALEGMETETPEELPENVFTALEAGKYQFTMKFSGLINGYGKILVQDGAESERTEAVYVTKLLAPQENETIEYCVVIQLAEGCQVSFEACKGEAPQDAKIVEHDEEILFSDLETTENESEVKLEEESDEEMPSTETTSHEDTPVSEEETQEETSPIQEDVEKEQSVESAPFLCLNRE